MTTVALLWIVAAFGVVAGSTMLLAALRDGWEGACHMLISILITISIISTTLFCVYKAVEAAG